MKKTTLAASAILLGVGVHTTMAQTSSLYVTQSTGPARQPVATRNEMRNPLSPAIVQMSLSAVKMPEPKKFAVHDLVTILVNENVQANSTSSMDAKKQTTLNGQVNKFPSFSLVDFLTAHLEGSTLSNGPGVDISSTNELKGDGTYSRKDSLTTCVSAEIIDVKPNGNLVLEARRNIDSDKETLKLTLTGVCRKDDVSADNTVQSTQLADLKLVKEHKGELSKVTKKGLISRILESIFAF